MILRKSRFVLVAAIVAFAAFLFGFGTLLTGAQPASRARPGSRPAAARHSGDDGGFSVILTEPTEAYLVGIQRIVIEPAVPPGDTVVGVDFFVDGRLSATDRRPPYSTEIDFGQVIKRHTIVVTAITAGGRRAKVSFVSRAADLEGGTTSPIALVPAVVRDAAGHFIDGLSVGDFVLFENGSRQPIVHFDDNPVPQSVAVAIQIGAGEETRSVFQRGATVLSGSLRSFDSLGLIQVASLSASPDPTRGAVAPSPTVGFSYDRALFSQQLVDLDRGDHSSGRVPLGEALLAATRGLQGRPRGRVLLALLAGPGPQETSVAAGPEEAETAEPEKKEGHEDPAQAAEDDLVAALDAVKKSGATLHVVVYGSAESAPFPQIKRVAEETGGEFLVAAGDEAVAASCRRVSESLQHQYLVSFAPPSLQSEGWRSIELRPRVPEHVIQARRTYFAVTVPKQP